MFLFVSVCSQGEGHPVTIAHGAVDITVQGTPSPGLALPDDNWSSGLYASCWNVLLFFPEMGIPIEHEDEDGWMSFQPSQCVRPRGHLMEIRDKEHKYDQQKSIGMPNFFLTQIRALDQD